MSRNPDDGMYEGMLLLAKAIGLTTPIVASGVLLFETIVKHPSVKRQEKMMEELASGLAKLVQLDLVTTDRLVNDDEVSAILLQAVQIAMRSTGQRKLVSLRNVALNGAKAAAGARTPAMVVMGILDRLTETHIIVLDHLKNGPRTTNPHEVKAFASTLAFGLPVTSDKSSLVDPVTMAWDERTPYFAERSDVEAADLALADLTSMSLIRPVYQQREEVEDRVAKMVETDLIVDHQLSKLGDTVLGLLQEPFIGSGPTEK